MAVTVEESLAPSGAEQPSVPSQRLLWAGWLAGAVTLVCCVALLPAVEGEPGGGPARVAARWFLEPWLAFGILLWVVRRRPIRQILRPAERALVGVLLVGTLVVQSLPMLDAYPLTDWSMYSQPTASMRYTEFRMVDAQGQPVGDLPIAELVPNTLGRGFMERLTEWVERAESGDREAVEVMERTLLALLDDVGDPQIVGVDARWCDVAAPTPEQPARCQTALSVRR